MSAALKDAEKWINNYSQELQHYRRSVENYLKMVAKQKRLSRELAAEVRRHTGRSFRAESLEEASETIRETFLEENIEEYRRNADMANGIQTRYVQLPDIPVELTLAVNRLSKLLQLTPPRMEASIRHASPPERHARASMTPAALVNSAKALTRQLQVDTRKFEAELKARRDFVTRAKNVIRSANSLA